MSLRLSSRKIINIINNHYSLFGGSRYTISEPLTILEHSIQTANWLKIATNDTNLIVAGLLHDYGHVCQGTPIDPSTKINDHHEKVGAAALLKLGFSEEVVTPINLHVLAKRYLCTVDAEYYKSLSHGSKLSFHLQGQKLNEHEMAQFKKNKYFHQAILLRHADDAGKSTIPGNASTGILQFTELLQSVL
jgi:putative nucleotidyltransferase with HDIG domain